MHALLPWLLKIHVWPWVMVMTHNFVVANNHVKYHPNPSYQWKVLAQKHIFAMCVLWPWPWRYDPESRSWHNLRSWTTILWSINPNQVTPEKFWPGHRFLLCMHCYLDLCNMAFSLVKVMKYPWVIDNICLNYRPNTRWQWKVLALTWIMTVPTVILTWGNIITQPWVLDDNCVKNHPNQN